MYRVSEMGRLGTGGRFALVWAVADLVYATIWQLRPPKLQSINLGILSVFVHLNVQRFILQVSGTEKSRRPT